MEFCKHIRFISMLNSARDAGAWGRGEDSTPPALDEQEQGGQSALMLSTDRIFLTFSSCIRSFVRLDLLLSPEFITCHEMYQ